MISGMLQSSVEEGLAEKVSWIRLQSTISIVLTMIFLLWYEQKRSLTIH